MRLNNKAEVLSHYYNSGPVICAEGHPPQFIIPCESLSKIVPPVPESEHFHIHKRWNEKSA